MEISSLLGLFKINFSKKVPVGWFVLGFVVVMGSLIIWGNILQKRQDRLVDEYNAIEDRCKKYVLDCEKNLIRSETRSEIELREMQKKIENIELQLTRKSHQR